MNSKSFLLPLFSTLFLLPIVASANNPYIPLIGIPGLGGGDLNFSDYINALYALSISVGALIAVIKIIIAGMKYMLSDIVTNKSKAIAEIQGAILGLIIVISAVLVLQVINPNITEFNTEITTNQATPKAGPAGGDAPPPNVRLSEPTTANCFDTGSEDPQEKYDCSGVSAACVSAGGKPKADKLDKIICEYGKTIIIACELTYPERQNDCAAATNKCHGLLGTPYQKDIDMRQNDDIHCVTPFK